VGVPARTSEAERGEIFFWIKSSGRLVKEVGLEKYKENPNLYSEREKNKFEFEYAFSLVKWELNCKSWEIRTLDGSDYDINKVSFGTKNTVSEFTEIYPGSLMDVAASKLCKR
jgi:hypothetical protein